MHTMHSRGTIGDWCHPTTRPAHFRVGHPRMARTHLHPCRRRRCRLRTGSTGRRPYARGRGRGYVGRTALAQDLGVLPACRTHVQRGPAPGTGTLGRRETWNADLPCMRPAPCCTVRPRSSTSQAGTACRCTWGRTCAGGPPSLYLIVVARKFDGCHCGRLWSLLIHRDHHRDHHRNHHELPVYVGDSGRRRPWPARARRRP